MSENTAQKQMAETVEKYRDFYDSLKRLISETQGDMGNIESMSEQVTLAEEPDNRIKNIRFTVRELEVPLDSIASTFKSIRDVATEVDSIKKVVAQVVIRQEEKAREKTESAIEIARKITGND